VLAWTPIDYTWHTFIGCAVTMVVGSTCSLSHARGAAD